MATQSTMSNSAIFDYEEQVDAKIKSEKRVGVISNSEEQVDAVSKAKRTGTTFLEMIMKL